MRHFTNYKSSASGPMTIVVGEKSINGWNEKEKKKWENMEEDIVLIIVN